MKSPKSEKMRKKNHCLKGEVMKVHSLGQSEIAYWFRTKRGKEKDCEEPWNIYASVS